MIHLMKKRLMKFFFIFILFFCIYFTVNLCFFNEKSIAKILKMNEVIIELNQELLNLNEYEKNIMDKIKFLSIETLNEDYISELAQKNLGLIKEDNVLVILDD